MIRLQTSIRVSFLIAALLCTKVAIGEDQFARITPTQAGYSEQGLHELEGFLRENNSSSMVLLKDGSVFFEFGDIYQPLLVHSIRKALLSGLYGAYWDQGIFDLNSTMEQLGIDDVHPSLSRTERSATLGHLLMARSGVYHLAAAESPEMKKSRPERGSHAPGSFHYYNNWDFNVAGAIFEQRTGESIYQAFGDRIARPLQMQQFKGVVKTIEHPSEDDFYDADGIYQYERERSSYPAYHFRLSTHDLALYGQLLLQRGVWQGRQIVSADWIDRSTQPWSVTNETYGLAYGMLWSVLVPDPESEAPPSFYHTGTGVHMLGVYPKHGLVMVHRVDTESAYEFTGDQLIQVIRLMHAARVGGTP